MGCFRGEFGVMLSQFGYEKADWREWRKSPPFVSFSSEINYLQDTCFSVPLHLCIQWRWQHFLW